MFMLRVAMSPECVALWSRDEKNLEQTELAERDPDIDSLPPILFNGRINILNDFYDIAEKCDAMLHRIDTTEEKIVPIGFDLEWPFSFQTGSGKTALAQICLSEELCYLFHIYDILKLPTSFIMLLSHPKVKLVGVNIKNDIWKLGRDFTEFPAKKVVENNCFDCGPFANIVYKRSCRWSLERLTAYVLRKKISKNSQVRRSKWHIQPLNDAQKLYAATDAYVSLLLHMTIQKKADRLTLSEKTENINSE
ncbi:Werner Syndrome-like exonuclease [Belonocnema kinseyi]|uniref:Werner Syndrome-like exonuclease n=1 Tax=Belonocnema kinseyi TaxID=2817044 RepID=UPI00143D71A3|nr:Werner Syndrome-like exonuclease [Belonocnema kinseyi]